MHIAELRKEDLVKHIRKRTIQMGRLFFSSSLSLIFLLFVLEFGNSLEVHHLVSGTK